MKKIILFIIIFSIDLYSLELSFPLYNSNEGCQTNPKIWLLDNNSDSRFEYLVYSGCRENAKVLKVNDKSKKQIKGHYKAFLKSGNLSNNNFVIFMVDSVNLRYTHKISCTGGEPVVIEDYAEFDNDFNTIESNDDYFITYQVGDIVVITKKTDIAVYAYSLFSLQGVEFYNRSVHDSESSYYLDFRGYSSGIYLVKFTVFDNELMLYKPILKKIIYLN
jgi:hypothetical protein